MKRKLIEGLIIASCLLGMVTSGFAIPLSFTFTGTINDGHVWDLNTDGGKPHSVRNDISGLGFMMTLTRLSSEPYFHGYTFDVDMIVSGYDFALPGGDFYKLHDLIVVQENLFGSPMYEFTDHLISGDSFFHITLDSDGTGKIAAGMGHLRGRAYGSFFLSDTIFNWTASSDNAVPVPEPGSMLLFGIGAIGIAGYKFGKK